MTRTWITGSLIAIAVTLLAVLASRTTAFQDMNLWSYDFLVNHRHETDASSRVLIADFDDPSFARIGQFPVPRDKVAELITRVSEGHPKVIGVDFLLSEERSAAQDQAMLQALSRAGNVILASQAASGGIPSVEPLAKFCRQDPASYGDCQSGALGFAFVNLFLDSDGFVRRMLLFSLDQHHSESFALQIAELYSGTALSPSGAKAARFGTHLVPYAETDSHSVLIGSWGMQAAKTVSAIDVLDGKVPIETFRDKIVLIGQSSDAARDREFTPVFRRATADGIRLRLSGTQIHAAGVETLLAGTAVKPLSFSGLIIATLLLVAASAAALLGYAPRYSITACFLLFISCYVLAQGLFSQRVSLRDGRGNHG